MKEEFIGESITPVKSSFDGSRTERGEPFFPYTFTWRGNRVEVLDILSKWKESTPCRSGSPERYLRRHWYEVRVHGGDRLKIYFDRQGTGRRRWHLYSRCSAES